MITKFLKWFKSLPAPMQIALLGVTAFIIFRLIHSGKGALGKLKQQSEIAGEEAVYKAKGQVKTYTDKQYSDFATKLYNAMNGAGTDFSAIKAVFNKMKHDLDVLNLEKKFGLRSSSYTSKFSLGFSDPSDLADWLQGDCSASQIAELNNLLSKKGITYSY
ncbi:MAG TPA: hypothetical protein PLP27_10945 [Crocinitomicaceae bacterium]|nr:hypothetical protein [Crocinitomicaceae bacterium]